MREYGAVLICFVVGGGFAAVVMAILRLVGPDARLARRGRMPDWWQRLTAWSRSRSLRVWCPNPATASLVTEQLQSEAGRRLSRLGVSIAAGPWSADVVVVESDDAGRLDEARAQAPQPVASIVLTDAADPDEFREALVALSAALRWPEESTEPDSAHGQSGMSAA